MTPDDLCDRCGLTTERSEFFEECLCQHCGQQFIDDCLNAGAASHDTQRLHRAGVAPAHAGNEGPDVPARGAALATPRTQARPCLGQQEYAR